MALLVDANTLTADIADIFICAGLEETAAATVADSLVQADRLGLASHGVMLSEMYVNRLRAGSVSAVVAPEVVSDSGAKVVLDGRNGFGVLSADHGMEIAIGKAKEYGAGIVGIRHAFHFGAARRFALQASSAGCIGIAMCNTRPLMPAPGGAERVVGNNPIAIAVPSAGEKPLVLDMATSEAAMGKIRMAAKRGEAIPSSWAVRADGSATTDPAEAIEGMLLPTAGPKGFGLALMIDLMCGLLSGGAMGAAVRPLYGDAREPYDCSHVLIAIDAGDAEAAAARAETFAESIRTGTRAPGVARLFTPGEPEWQHAADLGDKVRLDPGVAATLVKLAGELGAQITTDMQTVNS